jgi:transcriptional regulator, merR family
MNFKEKKTMEELNQASETLNKLSDKDVRIVYLPPATVGAFTPSAEPLNSIPTR